MRVIRPRWGVDIVLSLRRPDGNSNGNIRLIHALSRFRETPSRLAIELRPEGYVSLGTELALAVRQATEAILEVAAVGEGAALTGNELFALAKVKRTSGQEALNDPLRDGRLKRAGCGKRGAAFRYFVTEEIHSAGTSPYRAAESFSGSAGVPVGAPDERRQWGEVLAARLVGGEKQTRQASGTAKTSLDAIQRGPLELWLDTRRPPA